VCGVDFNQSELHNKIKAEAMNWFLAHGFKPIEFEVAIRKKWVADIVGAIQPSTTECIKLKFIKPRPKFVCGLDYWKLEGEERKQAEEDRNKLLEDHRQRYNVWFKETENFVYKNYTMVAEVKAFRSDFTKDINTKFKQTPAHMNFLAYEKGIIKKEEIPDGWFGLEHIGEERFKYHPGRIVYNEMDTQYDIVYNLSMRMHNAYHYAHMNERIKQQRSNDVERQNHYKVSRIISAVVDSIENGFDDESVEATLKSHGIKNVKDYDLKKIIQWRKDYGQFKSKD